MRKVTSYLPVLLLAFAIQAELSGCSFPPDIKAMTDAKQMVKQRIAENGGMIYNYTVRPIDEGTMDFTNTRVVAQRGNLFMVEVTVVATDVSGIQLAQYCLAVVEVIPNSNSFYYNRLSCVFTSPNPITDMDIQEMKERNGWDQWAFHTSDGGAE